jgi:cobalt transporter subunit CbtB
MTTGESREGQRNRWSREPGDLPAELPGEPSPDANALSSTEVVMLAQNTVLLTQAGWRLPAALFSAAFGGALLFIVGFAHSDILHNAAHDVRHAFVAPCH